MLLPVIMAGGSGSRLWPLSRSSYPKQFTSLATDKSMLQDTVSRLSGIEHQAPLFICNQEHRFILAEQLRQQNLQHGGIILEPIGKNTAPAVALAALHATSKGNDPLLLVLAADHVIQDQAAFNQAVQHALEPALKGMLVTFGITPLSPETGYGYIRRGNLEFESIYRVDNFVEKPNRATAEKYIASGEYYWNSGMFLFRASRFLSEIKTHRPDILQSCEAAIQGAHDDLDFIRVGEEAFIQCPNDSIDYAVMEKTKDAFVVPLNAGWSDVGSFKALWEVSDKNEDGNVTVGDVIADQTQNCYIYAQDKLVSSVGVDSLVIIETKDAVLVANKDRVEDVKNIVQQLKAKRRKESELHREVYRPWGSHDVIADGERYHVKHLKIKPGEATALQMHYHRAEHWVVVQGTAKVTNGDKAYLVTENESTYIPIGAEHRIENPGKVELHLIEVRTGSYLSEDDVKRTDEYKASK